MIALLGQWRFGLYGFAAAALLIAGWKAAGWRADSLKLIETTESLAQEKRERSVAEAEARRADSDRALVSAQLMDFQERTRLEFDALRSKVPVVVNNSSDCALGADAVGLLNAARGYKD